MQGPIFSALLKEVKAIQGIRDEVALPLLASEIQQGIGFGPSRAEEARHFAPGILSLIRRVPELIRGGAVIVDDPARPLVARFGVATALMYAAIPNNILIERSGSGYGYLDEWLLLQAAIFEYTGQPAEAGVSPEQARTMSAFVTQALPIEAIEAIVFQIQQLGQQSMLLPSIPAGQLEAALEAIVSSQVPAVWTPPMPALPADSTPGGVSPSVSTNAWSHYRSGGATWSDHRGSMYMRFPGGGSVAMSGGHIVVT